MSGARIVATAVHAAHDGVAEMTVTLEHANGGRSTVAMDEMATRALMKACGATVEADLVGQGWDRVRDALAVSWDRFRG